MQRAFREDFVAASCEGLERCCRGNGYAYVAARCPAAIGAELRGASFDPELEGRVHDPVAAAECLARTRALVSACGEISQRDLDAQEDVCDRVWSKRAPLGAICESSGECAPSPPARVYCVPKEPDGGAPAAICEARPAPAVGSPCDPDEFFPYCAEGGLRCDPRGRTCQPLRRDGEPCDGPMACTDGSFCDADAGTCAPRVASGACAVSAQCAADAFCDPAIHACAKRKEGGAACGGPEECRSYLCRDGRCLANRYASRRRCTAADRPTRLDPDPGDAVE